MYVAIDIATKNDWCKNNKILHLQKTTAILICVKFHCGDTGVHNWYER